MGLKNLLAKFWSTAWNICGSGSRCSWGLRTSSSKGWSAFNPSSGITSSTEIIGSANKSLAFFWVLICFEFLLNHFWIQTRLNSLIFVSYRWQLHFRFTPGTRRRMRPCNKKGFPLFDASFHDAFYREDSFQFRVRGWCQCCKYICGCMLSSRYSHQLEFTRISWNS